MSQHTSDSVPSIVAGFVLAVGNHTFGWFHSILEINGTALNDYLQAFITGGFGAIGAYCVGKGIKYVERKIKNLSKNLGSYSTSKGIEYIELKNKKNND